MNSKTFCLAPWVHSTVVVNAEISTCCLSQTRSEVDYSEHKTWWCSDVMENLRSDLANGVRNTNCNKCWQAEDLGHESLRQGYNRLFKPYTNFAQIREDIKNKNYRHVDLPTTWEIDIGNSCNLKCIMCDPTRSDKIQIEVSNNSQKFVKFPKLIAQAQAADNTNWIESDSGQAFLADIKQNLKWLKIQGGEALAVKGIRDLIENLDSREITLSITTNGTVLDQRLLAALSKFKKVEISISVEAIGPANNVIRYGSNWNTIEKNILLLTQYPNVDLQLNHVLQNTSTIFLPDVIKFAEQHNLHLSVLKLTDPKYLSLSSIPLLHIDRMIDSIEPIEITNPRNQTIKQYLKNIRNVTEYDQQLNVQFHDYVSTLDEIRTEKLSPYLEPILNTP